MTYRKPFKLSECKSEFVKVKKYGVINIKDLPLEIKRDYGVDYWLGWVMDNGELTLCEIIRKEQWVYGALRVNAKEVNGDEKVFD